MGQKTFMVIAGEASGDTLAAELVTALRTQAAGRPGSPELTFFGVGGASMAAAGVDLIFDLARNAVFGAEALVRIFEFKRRFFQLLKIAIERRPDAIICVDFAGFNRRFAHAVKKHVAGTPAGAGAWNPKIVQYVSPQVWASRPRRAELLARDVDLLLSIFPFEKQWYAERVPAMRVEFVGHPVVDRFSGAGRRGDHALGNPPRLVVLPGSRPSELKRHLPVLRAALELVRAKRPVDVTMVMPEPLIEQARAIGLPPNVTVRPGGLADALGAADAAIAKSGTITLECAYFGVPTVAMYKTSWLTYEIARRIVSVKWIAMPNILANEEIFPEFVQEAATPENIARTTLEFLDDSARRTYVKTKLREIVASLGAPGAAKRAADAILNLVDERTPRAVANQGQQTSNTPPA